jgi:hypothetical protein
VWKPTSLSASREWRRAYVSAEMTRQARAVPSQAMIDDGTRSGGAREESSADQEPAESGNTSAALRRVLQKTGDPHILDVLTKELAGTDLTTLLLEVMRRRSRSISPAELMRRYETSRFVAPATVPYPKIRTAEAELLRRLPPQFEIIALAPVLPLGSHSGPRDGRSEQGISTVRGNEVAADPTNGLALEAAARRKAQEGGTTLTRERASCCYPTGCSRAEIRGCR